jgi:hypothetical protein
MASLVITSGVALVLGARHAGHDAVVCENSADGLCGLAVVELEHAAEPLTAPYRARFE